MVRWSSGTPPTNVPLILRRDYMDTEERVVNSSPLTTHTGKAGVAGVRSSGLVLRAISDRAWDKTTYPNPPTPPSDYAEISVFADIVSLKLAKPELPISRQGRGIRRGRVSQFSKRSRVRMIRTMAKMRNMDRGFFVTLTWPGRFENDAEKWKSQMQNFFKRLRRFMPELRGVWRMEFKVRLSGAMEGFIAPHIHLLLFGFEDYVFGEVNALRGWIATNWSACIPETNADHLAAGTQADVIYNRQHATRYASKYAAKNQEAFSIVAPVGRHWGYWGEWDISELLTVTLTFPQFQSLKVKIANCLRSGDNERRWHYGNRLMRAPDYYGFQCLQMGDMSKPGDGEWENSTIMKLLSRIVE